MEGWDEIASSAVQAAFLRDVCEGMSKPDEWGDHTKLGMRFGLKMYAHGFAAGMERAAEICSDNGWKYCADAIRTEIKGE
jgi:hypothetical protein